MQWPERKLKRQGQILDGLDCEAEEFRPDCGHNGEIFEASLRGNSYRIRPSFGTYALLALVGWKVKNGGEGTTWANAAFHDPVLATGNSQAQKKF